jgi:tetratricopeptide (TPR) repeat protein
MNDTLSRDSKTENLGHNTFTVICNVIFMVLVTIVIGGICEAQPEFGRNPHSRRCSADIKQKPTLAVLSSCRAVMDVAIREYRMALSIDPNYVNAHNNLANAHDEEGRTDEAIQEYLTAIRIMPLYATAQYNLAVVLERAGNAAAAREHCLYACRVYPNRYCPAESEPQISARGGWRMPGSIHGSSSN